MLHLLASAMLATGCVPGGEFAPRLCPPALPAITELRIERQAIVLWRTSAEPPCDTFRVSERDVRRFLGNAGRADPHEVHMTLPESACAAQGSVRFADGGRGQWQVDRFALGWLDRPGRARMTLYCRRCRRHPWAQ